MTLEFARLWAFAALPLPLLTWWLLPPHRPRAALPVPPGVSTHLAAHTAGGAGGSARVPFALVRILGWLALVLGLAGPQTERETLLSPTGRDLVIAIDLSASMAETDMVRDGLPVERYAVVRDLLGAFIERREGDRVALIAFASEAFLVAPLTFDVGAIAALVDELRIGLPGRRTDLGRAIGLTVRMLRQEPPGERVMVLLSDGQDNTGRLTADAAARLAAASDLTIHTIGFAAELDPANTAGLRQIAETTGGRYFPARSADALALVETQIDGLVPIVADDRDPRLMRDWSWICYAVAMAALAAAAWREARP